MMDLLGSSSSEDEDVAFKINKNYAKNYETWRKKEEKQKLLDKYGEAESTGSSSEEEEIRSTAQMDKDWLRAYAVVRFKQPRLYKEGEKFFTDTAKPVSKKKEKKMTLKDHERKFILEKGGIDSDDESKSKTYQGKSYYEEQEEIKKSLKEAIGDSSEGESEEEKDILVRAQKTAEERQQEDNEYLEWLKGERESLGDPEAEKELAPLKEYWNDPTLDEKEKVLRDYILNNGYMDQEESDDSSDDEAEGPDLDEEEKFLDEAEKYEKKYNFRHEEPGGDEIRSYPRVIESSVRTKDTRRAEKRKQKLERKNKEKEKVKDEIRLLQKLQMEEKLEKLDKLRKLSNKPDLDYDLDADFDPEEHAKIMQKYFDEDYYENDDDDKKPTFEYDAEIDEEEDEWWKERLQEEGEEGKEGGEANEEEQAEEELDADDPNFIMDADYDPTRDYKAEKKRAKKGKGTKKLPLFDPTEKTFDEYIDAYLKDKINDLPFTYRKVVPNDYGLSTEEILSLPDRELNAWVSVKKMSQHLSAREEREEQKKYQARASDPSKKFKILPSLMAKQEDESKAKKKKKKRKRKKTGDQDDKEEENTKDSDSESEQSGSPPAKKLKHLLPGPSGVGESTGKKKKQKNGLEPSSSKDSTPVKVKTIDKGSAKLKKSVKETTSNNAGDSQTNGTDLLKKKKKIEKEHGETQKTNDVPAESSDNAEQSTSGDVPLKKKKKKKKKKPADQEVKTKGKKISIQMNKKSESGGRELEKQLSKIMSTSRMGKFGIGPSADKEGKKKKKKKNNVE